MNDFLEGCWSDVDPERKDRGAFQQSFCARCRNAQCVHAQKAQDAFTQRMTTQVDRLFNPPEWADDKDPRYANRLTDFVDVSEVANKIELFSSPRKPAEAPKKERPDWKERYMGPMDEPLPENDPELEAEPSVPEEATQVKVVPPSRPQEQPSLIIRPGNTSVPAGGIILPGRDPGPVRQQQPEIDPWEIPAGPKVKVVERGATVKMGEPNK